jgi:hypothetical protein
MNMKINFYSLHRGGRNRSVDYFERHLHRDGCSCHKLIQDTPVTIEAPTIDMAVDEFQLNHFAHDDMFVHSECLKEGNQMPKDTAQDCFNAVMEYLDQTTRAHNCVGYDCVVCSLHAERGTELLGIIRETIKENEP